MKLSKKTFCYSISMAAGLMVLIILYFVFMLPSLYVEYVNKDNVESVAEVQKGYMESRSYKDLIVKNPTGCVSIEIPYEGDEIYLAGKAFRITVKIDDADVLAELDKLRIAFMGDVDYTSMELPEIDFDLLKEKLVPEQEIMEAYPLSLQIELSESHADMREAREKIHVISDSIVVYEGGISDEQNQYTTYLAMGKTQDALIFSSLPVMTPQMKEIRPIVLGSMPMIAAVVFLAVLLASQIFSKMIVTPVIRLSQYAQEVEAAKNREIMPLSIREKDEIGQLGRTLNGLYAKLRSQYQELAKKNKRLADENKRQEVFLRASSHQLKTPVSAALLLVEGMIGKIGKYSDTQKYLPQVKQQLLSMRKIIEDILYLNHCAENLTSQPVELQQLLEEVVDNYQIQAERKDLQFHLELVPIIIDTDRDILKKILDNLISNAVAYTPDGQSVDITFDNGCICICNYGAHIEEDILPGIYDPFVSSISGQKGKGLGLYVVSYYTELLGYRITIGNIEGGVMSTLVFEEGGTV